MRGAAPTVRLAVGQQWVVREILIRIDQGTEEMAKNVVVGTQWGDEGKGKIVDWLTDNAQGVDCVSRAGTMPATRWWSGRCRRAGCKLNLVPPAQCKGGPVLHRQWRRTRHPSPDLRNQRTGTRGCSFPASRSAGMPIFDPVLHIYISTRRSIMPERGRQAGDQKIGTTGGASPDLRGQSGPSRPGAFYDLFPPGALRPS